MSASERKTDSTSRVILKTAGKTTAILCVLLVLVCALFLLLAPMRASDFFYSLGMKRASAALAYSAALGSDDFDDWWSALVKSVSADDNRKGYEAADRLENHKDFTSKISDKEITVGQYSYNGKYYVAYQKARCGLLSNPDKKDVMWRYCRDWTLENGWGKYIAGNMYSSNPIKGFVDALCQNKDIPLGDTLDRLESLYNKSGEFADMPSYSGKKDVAYTAVKLIEARENEVSQQQKDIWNGRI